LGLRLASRAGDAALPGVRLAEPSARVNSPGRRISPGQPDGDLYDLWDRQDPYPQPPPGRIAAGI